MEKNFDKERFEHLTEQMKATVLQLDTMAIPSVDAVKDSLNTITEIQDIIYCSKRLYEVWELVYPDSLFDTPYKTKGVEDKNTVDGSKEEREKYKRAIEYGLRNFKLHERNDWTGDHINHYHRIAESPTKQRFFTNYLNDVRIIFKTLCQYHDIIVSDNFTIEKKINSSLEAETLIKIYEYLTKNKYLHSDNETQSAFLSLFSNVLLPQKGLPIVWLKTNDKTGIVNYAALYTLFKSMDIDIDDIANRKLIANFFIAQGNNPIDFSQIRIRQDSDALNKLKADIRHIIESH